MWGKELYFDATSKVEANASLDSMRSRSLMEHGLEEHLAGIFPEEEQPQEGANTLQSTAVGPAGQVEGHKRSQKQMRASTVGLLGPDASSGRWLGGATGEWRISGQAPLIRTPRRCNARTKARAG